MGEYPESDPRHHTAKLKAMLVDTLQHAREDVAKVRGNPRAQALFETTAEVLNGLKTAYDHFEEGEEEAWK